MVDDLPEGLSQHGRRRTGCQHWCRRCRSRHQGPARRSSNAGLSSEIGVQPEGASCRDLEPLSIEDLRADVGVDPDQVKRGVLVARSAAPLARVPSAIENPNF